MFAPSLPLRTARPAEAGPDVGGAASAAGMQDIAALSKVLCRALGNAGTGLEERDRVACREAARCAAVIHRLLTEAKETT